MYYKKVPSIQKDGENYVMNPSVFVTQILLSVH